MIKTRKVIRIATEILKDGSVLLIEINKNIRIFTNYWHYNGETIRYSAEFYMNHGLEEDTAYERALEAFDSYKKNHIAGEENPFILGEGNPFVPLV